MKKHYILGLTLVGAFGFLALQRTSTPVAESFSELSAHKLNAAGAGTGNTGAPGEQSCVACHNSGTVQDGTATNNLLVLDGVTPVSNYTPGMTYSVSLTLNSGDVKEGFQATVLDLASDAMAGSFPGINLFGTAITSGSGRDYANHTATSNDEGNFSWVWDWEAPATDVGPVRFYVATNIADGTGNQFNDVIYLSEHTLGSNGIGLDEVENDIVDFSAGYATESNEVVVNFSSSAVDQMFLNVVDLNGKSVFTSHLGESQLGSNSKSVSLPGELKTGMYIVNFFVGNRAMSDKIMIQK